MGWQTMQTLIKLHLRGRNFNPNAWFNLIVLGFNKMSTQNVDHFVATPREREKRHRRDTVVKEMKERDKGEKGK